jgi:CheY-like chemotaxis protein
VTLPITEEHPADETEASASASGRRAAGRPPTLDGLRVLVVDDVGDSRELMSAILAQGGAEVTVAATVQAALDALDQASFDVLISDIALPDGDGYALMRTIRARDAARGGRIPALALTAYARTEDRDQAIAAGYDRHAAKLIEPAELEALVGTLARRTAAR